VQFVLLKYEGAPLFQPPPPPVQVIPLNTDEKPFTPPLSALWLPDVSPGPPPPTVTAYVPDDIEKLLVTITAPPPPPPESEVGPPPPPPTKSAETWIPLVANDSAEDSLEPVPRALTAFNFT
jgi:hypothetical protein